MSRLERIEQLLNQQIMSAEEWKKCEGMIQANDKLFGLTDTLDKNLEKLK